MTRPVFMPSDARIEVVLFGGYGPGGHRRKYALLRMESEGGGALRVRDAMVDVDAAPGFAKRLAVAKASTYGYKTQGDLLANLQGALELICGDIHAHLFVVDRGTLNDIQEPMHVEMHYYSHATDSKPIKLEWWHTYEVVASVGRAGARLEAVS